MILRVHVPGAAGYEIGDEIWQESLADAIATEADRIACRACSDLLESPDDEHREHLRNQLVAEMTAALVAVGDRYRARNGVLYSLEDQPASELTSAIDSLREVSSRTTQPIVEQVLRFEDVTLGSGGSRRALVRWSDGTEDVAITWYADEVLVCEGDLVGKTRDQIRSLHFRRDRDWLQS
jgi:hypothetical protein